MIANQLNNEILSNQIYQFLIKYLLEVGNKKKNEVESNMERMFKQLSQV
jgi:hypothetical protein